jgi:hypothetical protein
MAKRPTARSKDSDTTPTAPPKPKTTRSRAPAAKPAAEQTPVGPTAASPTDEDIRRRAYERYQQRGGNHGQHFDDWLEAEKELRTRK